MDVEEARALVLDGGDSGFSLSEWSSDGSLLSSSEEEELNLDQLALEDEGGGTVVMPLWKAMVTVGHFGSGWAHGRGRG